MRKFCWPSDGWHRDCGTRAPLISGSVCEPMQRSSGRIAVPEPPGTVGLGAKLVQTKQTASARAEPAMSPYCAGRSVCRDASTMALCSEPSGRTPAA